jgi:hypothetical protein
LPFHGSIRRIIPEYKAAPEHGICAETRAGVALQRSWRAFCSAAAGYFGSLANQRLCVENGHLMQFFNMVDAGKSKGSVFAFAHFS